MTIKGVIKYGQHSVKYFSSGAASLVDRFTKNKSLSEYISIQLKFPFKIISSCI